MKIKDLRHLEEEDHRLEVEDRRLEVEDHHLGEVAYLEEEDRHREEVDHHLEAEAYLESDLEGVLEEVVECSMEGSSRMGREGRHLEVPS